jgi:hypothetical protein
VSAKTEEVKLNEGTIGLDLCEFQSSKLIWSMSGAKSLIPERVNENPLKNFPKKAYLGRCGHFMLCVTE